MALSGELASGDWNDVQTEVDLIIETSPEPFLRDTCANVLDLITACKSTSSFPKGVSKGYWPTLRMFWPRFEIEVFEDRLEVYHFRDGGFQVWYEEHHPGTQFSQRFLTELTAVSEPNLC
jgi:hypothetical protein